MVGVSHVVARVKHLHRLVKSKIRERYKEKTRSPKWKKTKTAFLLKNSKCIASGQTKHLQVHHILPYHKYPALELEPSNLATCCMAFGCECHLIFAHGDDWRAWNENVRADADVVLHNPSLRDEFAAKAKANRKI